MAASFLRPSTFRAQDQEYLRKRFVRHARVGQWAASWLLDVREMRTIEQTILQGNEERVMAFKTGQTAAVGMTAVASAIIAQLSSTTLQIPALSSINWTASALIITALLFAILSTLMSVILQQTLTALNDPTGFRMWLSNGSCRGSRKAPTPGLDGEHMETSVASVTLLRLPNFFLLCGVACFLVGFGLLLGFAWVQELETTPSRDSNFSVLVLYVTVGTVAFLGTGGILRWKMTEVHDAETTAGKDLEEGRSDDEGGGDEDGDENVGKGLDETDELLSTRPKTNKEYQKKQRAVQVFSSERDLGHHEHMVKALEEAARAHRNLVKLMRDTSHESSAQDG